METWTWATNSVRPYESLWILTSRFLWLNAISSHTLGREFGFRAWCKMDLITAGSGLHRRSVQEARQRLIKLLTLTKLQARQATIRGSLIIDANNLHNCPECLRKGYHTAIFQLRALARCPLHGCKLTDRCPHCGATLPLALDRYSAKFPFACVRCRELLAGRAAILHPPTLGDVSVIREVWRTLAEMPRVEWTRAPSEQNMLAELTSRMLEERIRTGRKTTLNFHLSRPPKPHPSVSPPNIGERCYLLTAREQRSVAIYKSYRRHLETRTPGGRQFAQKLLDRLNSGMKGMLSSSEGWDTSGLANAFGLFRYAVEWRGFEGIRSVHARRSTWINPATQRRCLPDGGLVPALQWPREFRSRPVDQQWIEDHVLVVALRSIAIDCYNYGMKVMRLGGVVRLPDGIELLGSEADAAAIAFFNDTGQLEFWSAQFDRSLPPMAIGGVPIEKAIIDVRRIKRIGPNAAVPAL